MMNNEGRKLRFACFGDSITSDQVTGIGTVVAEKLHADLVGNFACGYATCTDWHLGKVNTTKVTLEVPQNTNTSDNVLSNQIRRALQYTTPLGEEVSWNHPQAGRYVLDSSMGTGLGYTEQKPDIIYIAVGTNDGNNVQNRFEDDADMVMQQEYKELTRTGFASSLRWAVETLQCVYPEAQIFVATPLQTASESEWMSYEAENEKRKVVQAISAYCKVNCIDSFMESGFTPEVALAHNTDVHPDDETKEMIATYVAAQIEQHIYNKISD